MLAWIADHPPDGRAQALRVAQAAKNKHVGRNRFAYYIRASRPQRRIVVATLAVAMGACCAQHDSIVTLSAVSRSNVILSEAKDLVKGK